jgi:hypothetical protein
VNTQEIAEFKSHLARAIRTLKALESIETSSPRQAVDLALSETKRAYIDLLTSARTLPIPSDAEPNVQYIVDRLREHLRSFGELVKTTHP